MSQTVDSLRPKWEDAPIWASFLTCNENGHHYWWEYKPKLDRETHQWVRGPLGGRVDLAGSIGFSPSIWHHPERGNTWLPIESAPKDGRAIVLHHPSWHKPRAMGGWDAHEMAWRIDGHGCVATQPTLWHPAPPLPDSQ